MSRNREGDAERGTSQSAERGTGQSAERGAGQGAERGAPPPYLRIVAEIRRRIDEGELAPGDRVPSTREIAREWGVALATATKALTRLSLEGVVEARPRVGTVVAARMEAVRGPAAASAAARAARSPEPAGAVVGTRGGASAGPDLTQERIVRAAVAIADTEGLGALSMRGVAARLGVATMSLYRHVGSKEDLVLLMADAAFGEATYPATPPEGWRARLELGAHTLWRLFRAHPWLAHLSPLSRPLMLPNLIAHGEWILGALDGHGLDPVTMFDLHVLLYSHVQGMAVNLEREAQAEAVTGLTEEEWMARQSAATRAIIASGRYPAFNKVITSFGDTGYDLNLDALFTLGVSRLLDGMTPMIEGTNGPPRG
ncbi:GntR family transcriptional regulator [Streptomyces sp. URMC 123]|uniref:GntR family transcriptional regulator n=1 Tax=Streptomyces sp. URMC 123 TaxID=3423403 RepID=UPI003F1E4235